MPYSVWQRVTSHGVLLSALIHHVRCRAAGECLRRKFWTRTLSCVCSHLPSAADPPYIVAAQDAAFYLNNQDRVQLPPSMHTPMVGDFFQREQNAYKQLSFQNETLVKEWTALYYAMVTQVDKSVGELMAELDLQQVAQNTLGKCMDVRNGSLPSTSNPLLTISSPFCLAKSYVYSRPWRVSRSTRSHRCV